MPSTVDLATILRIVPRACARDTSQRDDWTPARPTTGHCAIVSELIRVHFGGTIARALMSNDVVHYFNVLRGSWVDATRSQFDNNIYPVDVVPDCPRDVYWFQDTEDKFFTFNRRFWVEHFKGMELIGH